YCGILVVSIELVLDAVIVVVTVDAIADADIIMVTKWSGTDIGSLNGMAGGGLGAVVDGSAGEINSSQYA
ncbi:15890_t:CDS:2, partial [Gigaspora rosea]